MKKTRKERAQEAWIAFDNAISNASTPEEFAEADRLYDEYDKIAIRPKFENLDAQYGPDAKNSWDE